ncbi:hypothetical protein OH492_09235 [Vibrio chagasii]|nr:hypothetical protein [Vibrio chagasii]
MKNAIMNMLTQRPGPGIATATITGSGDVRVRPVVEPEDASNKRWSMRSRVLRT